MVAITVIMGVYCHNSENRELKKSIESILNQTVKDLEFLICDDGSDQQTQRLLNRIAQEDNRIRLIRTGKPSCHAHKLNLCLAEATGVWIARQDDDDISLPQRLEKQVDYLKMHENIAFTGCDVIVFDRAGIYDTWNFPEYPLKENFLFKQPFIHPALLFRRSALEQVGGYSDSKWTEMCEDYDLLLRLYEAGMAGHNIKEVLFEYRVEREVPKKRLMRHRLNEAVVRYQRFYRLGMLPKAFPYVAKPLIVGLIPIRLVAKLKKNTTDKKDLL